MRKTFFVIATAFITISASAQMVTVTIGTGFSGWKQALAVPADQRHADWYKALERMVVSVRCDDAVRQMLATRFGFAYAMKPAEDIAAKDAVNDTAKQAGCQIPD